MIVLLILKRLIDTRRRTMFKLINNYIGISDNSCLFCDVLCDACEIPCDAVFDICIWDEML